MTIVGTNPDAVIGGTDTHADMHVAAVVNHVGCVLGVESFPTTIKGYRQRVSWLASHGELTLVGVEGTGSYGVGVARYLARAGVVPRLAPIELDFGIGTTGKDQRQNRHHYGRGPRSSHRDHLLTRHYPNHAIDRSS